MAPSGILNQTFAIILVVVGLLSGSLSVLREIQLMYLPAKATDQRIFWAWVRIAFVIAAVLLWVDEHSKVGQLSTELSTAKAEKQPVQLNVPPINVPPAQVVISPQMAYMSSNGSAIVASSYKIGGHVAVSSGCKNLSPSAVAENASCVVGLHLVDTELNPAKQPIVTEATEEKGYKEFQREIASVFMERKSYGPGEYGFKTVYSPEIDQRLDEALRNEVKTVLVLGEYVWSDGTGKHTNQYCVWLQNYPGLFNAPGTIATNAIITWHSCVNHNGLKK